MKTRRYILKVDGGNLNLKNPNKNWLADEQLDTADKYDTWWHLVEKQNGNFIIVSSSFKDKDTVISLHSSQTTRFMTNATIHYRFKITELVEFIDQIKEVTGKTSFPFYVYK